MLALALTAAIPTEYGGLGGRVLYIDTEKAFSPVRMVEMATHRYGEAGRLPASLNLKSIMARVLVHQVSSTEEIAQLLDGEERMIEDGVVLVQCWRTRLARTHIFFPIVFPHRIHVYSLLSYVHHTDHHRLDCSSCAQGL